MKDYPTINLTEEQITVSTADEDPCFTGYSEPTAEDVVLHPSLRPGLYQVMEGRIYRVQAGLPPSGQVHRIAEA